MSVLFISGHAGLVGEAEGDGDFLAKPFTEAQLAKAVGLAIEKGCLKRKASSN
jgi:FixJ family two-component response regulator